MNLFDIWSGWIDQSNAKVAKERKTMLFARSSNDKNTLFNTKYRVAVIKCFIVIQRIFRIVASYAITTACCRFCYLPMHTFNIIITFISFHSTTKLQPTKNTIQLLFFHRVKTLCAFEMPLKIHFPNANLGFCELAWIFCVF